MEGKICRMEKIQWKSARRWRITKHNRGERKSETIWLTVMEIYVFFLRIAALLKIKVPFFYQLYLQPLADSWSWRGWTLEGGLGNVEWECAGVYRTEVEVRMRLRQEVRDDKGEWDARKWDRPLQTTRVTGQGVRSWLAIGQCLPDGHLDTKEARERAQEVGRRKRGQIKRWRCM